MTATLDDYATSARIVEILRRVATQEINKQRPRPTYAVVTGVDRAQRTAFVLLPGETDSIGVQMGSIEPKTTGQIARIEGLPGDRYLADVIGEPYLVAPGTDPSYVSATTYDAVGDLLVGGGPDSYLRLPVGADGYILTADSTMGGGLKWGPPSAVTLTPGSGISVGGTSPNFTIGNTGVLSIAVNSPLTSTGGQTPTLGFSGTPSFTSVTLADGSLSTPAVNFTADPNTGLRRTGTDTLALVVGGVDGLTVGPSSTTIINTLILPTSGAGVEFGSTSASNSPTMDFHSSGNNIDYDSRITAQGGSGSVGQGTLILIGGTVALRGSTATEMQNSVGTVIFKFEPATANADGFTGKVTFPSGALDGGAITNGTIPWGKLSAAAQAVIAVTNPDTTFGFLRSATASTADANGNSIGNLGTSGGTRVTDGLAYDGVALKGTSGTTANDAFMVFGPYYGYIANTGIADNLYPNQGYGLKPGQYRARVFVRVSSAASTSAAFAVQVFDALGTNIVENGVDTVFTPAQLGSTSYVAVAIPFTVTATTRTTTNGNGLQVRVRFKTAAGVDVYVSHVVVEPYEGPTPNEIITTYIRDAAITSAKINDLQANKITAGMITTDDINLGTGGRLWTGEAGSTKSSGARLVFTGGSSAATRGIFAYDSLGNTTLAVQSDGTVIISGTFKTGVTGKRWEISSSPGNSLIGYSAAAGETTPGVIYVDATGGAQPQPLVAMNSGVVSGGLQAGLAIVGSNNTNTNNAAIQMTADLLQIRYTDNTLIAQIWRNTDEIQLGAGKITLTHATAPLLRLGNTFTSGTAEIRLTSAGATNYNSKITGTGGTATDGSGTLTLTATDLVLAGIVTVNSTLYANGAPSSGASIATAETTTSGSYVNLTTTGPVVTCICPPSGRILVCIDFWASNTAVNNRCTAAVKVENRATPGSGAYTLVANPGDTLAADYITQVANSVSQACKVRIVYGTPGYEYQFTLQYKTGAGTATFQNRLLSAVPLLN